MKITNREWRIFILIAIIGIVFWLKFEYPRFSYVRLRVDKKEAVAIADKYLESRGVKPGEYESSVIFDSDEWADRYLQKTLGLGLEKEFIQRQRYDLFFWQIRFFKELQKEEYFITISADTGAILSFHHLIEDIEPREDTTKDSAKKKAELFLKGNYNLNLNEYGFHEEKVKRYEKRQDYSFSWEKKGVYIPWLKGGGGAKLLIGVTVSGDEIKEFYAERLDIPEKFRRYIENQFMLGEYISSFYFLLFTALLVFSIFILLKRKGFLSIYIARKWFYSLATLFIFLNILYIFNNIESISMAYPTSVRFSYFMRTYFIKAIISLFFIAVSFVIPGLAGESLCVEVFPHNKYSCFSHYLKAGFFNRGVTRSLLLGYLVFFIVIGFQGIIFHFGQMYLGVWREWFNFTQFSSSYIPLFSVFVVALSASINEEVTFRLFGISLGVKYLKNVILSVVLLSFIWGLGHSAYPVFPAWFRVIEVSLIGFIFGFIFLRYGIIALLTAHYLVDAFLGVAAYILGDAPRYLFYSSIFLLLLPLGFALVAYILNKEDKEKDIKTKLSKLQKYNLGILITYISTKKSQGYGFDRLERELMEYGWDKLLIDLAFTEVAGSGGK